MSVARETAQTGHYEVELEHHLGSAEWRWTLHWISPDGNRQAINENNILAFSGYGNGRYDYTIERRQREDVLRLAGQCALEHSQPVLERETVRIDPWDLPA